MSVKNILRLGRLRQRFEKFLVAELKARGFDDLAPGHCAIAATLHAKGPLTKSELALFVEKRKPTVTVLVNKLQKHDLVTCAKDRYDQRVTRVRLTKAGEKFSELTRQLSEQVVNKAAGDLTEEQQEMFTETLRQLLHNLREYR